MNGLTYGGEEEDGGEGLFSVPQSSVSRRSKVGAGVAQVVFAPSRAGRCETF